MKIWSFIIGVTSVVSAVAVMPHIVYGGEINRGLEIALEADRRNSGFGDYQVSCTMILRNREGQESTRALRSKILETDDDGDKSLTVFDSPRDVRGTSLLTFSHKTKDDDQWLYLPALKRVKRISSSNKSGRFMGSEFSYEDFGSREVEKYHYNYLGDQLVGGVTCFVVEMKPKSIKSSGYMRIVSWVDQIEYRVLKEEYYDKKDKLLKSLSLKKYRKYLGSFWRSHRLHMKNHQNGKETELLFADFSFQTGLTQEDFTKTSLKRSR